MQRFSHIPTWKQHRRGGFTLVELLVVIVVIAILASLLIVAVTGATKRAREAQVVAEMGGIDSAMVQFKNRYGVNVPSFIVLCEAGADWNGDWDSTPPMAGITNVHRRASIAFLRGVWPDIDLTYSQATPTAGEIDLNGDGDAVDVLVLNGTECLVFFLGGVFQRGPVSNDLADDVQIGFAANPTFPFGATSTSNRIGPFVTFNVARYTDVDGDEVPEYRDPLPGQQRPYIFVSSYDGRGYQPYGINGTQNDADDEIPLQGGTGMINDIYRQDDRNPSTPPPLAPALNPNSFQIISPGGDDFEFGAGGEYNGERSVNVNERDNITNFKNGRLN